MYKIRKNEICSNCFNKRQTIEYNNVFRAINNSLIDLYPLETIIINNIPENNKCMCEICKFNIKTNSINFNIYNIPKFLIFIFDFNSSNLLKVNKNKTRKPVVLNFNFTLGKKNYKYVLGGSITMDSMDHYTYFFSNQIISDKLKKKMACIFMMV